MSLPDRSLELSITEDDLDQWTLGDMVIFDPEGVPWMEYVTAIRRVLINHSNWTRVEVERITLQEMEDVGEQIYDAFLDTAVPLESESASESGPAVIPDRPASPPATDGQPTHRKRIRQANSQVGTSIDKSESVTASPPGA